MADFNTIAQQFVEFYYKTFDANRADLRALYRTNSMLTFETAAIQGVDGIMEKLASLPFQKVEHKVSTIDAQPTLTNNGIVVLVTGALLTDGESNPMSFSQVFQLVQENQSYFVQNDIFKLIYG